MQGKWMGSGSTDASTDGSTDGGTGESTNSGTDASTDAGTKATTDGATCEKHGDGQQTVRRDYRQWINGSTEHKRMAK